MKFKFHVYKLGRYLGIMWVDQAEIDNSLIKVGVSIGGNDKYCHKLDDSIIYIKSVFQSMAG
jgi:hypothetical protein